MSFRPRMQNLIDSFEGQAFKELWETRERLLAKRSEIDRKLSALNRAMRNQRKASKQAPTA